MDLSHQDLARAQVSARVREAQQGRPGHGPARMLSTGRRAVQFVQQARLAIARTL